MQTIFSTAPASADARNESAMEEIRQAMLLSLGQAASQAHPVVQLRVMHALDVEDLWYLRGDVMAALASIEGEAVARSKLSELTDKFTGYLPKGLVSRPSPLGN